MHPYYMILNTRQMCHLNPIEKELTLDADKNYLFDLSHLSGMHVLGDRAAEFLQGQLSCDLREVTEHTMRQGALCNIKGRVLALMDVVDWAHHGLHLILPSDLWQTTQTTLGKTALFSRVSLTAAEEYHPFGFYGQDLKSMIPFNAKLPTAPFEVSCGEGYCCYSIGHQCYIFLINHELSAHCSEPFINNGQWRGGIAWHRLQLKHKRIEIYPETRGQFLPHRLGLPLSGYISFNKGCYKGQEIIARMHYRSTPKHELKLFKLETDEPIRSGQKIMNESNKIEIGELIDYCPLVSNQYLVAASILFEHPTQARLEGHQHIVHLEIFP